MDPFRDLAVCRRFRKRNLREFSPHLLLEVGSAQDQGQIELLKLACEVVIQLVDRFAFEVGVVGPVAFDLCAFGLAWKADGDETFFAPGNPDRSNGRIKRFVFNLHGVVVQIAWRDETMKGVLRRAGEGAFLCFRELDLERRCKVEAIPRCAFAINKFASLIRE